MLNKMRGVKRKLTAHAEEESRLHNQAAARISHLDKLYHMNTVEDVQYESWSRRRLDRLLADYLLRHGFNDSASELATEKNIHELVDVETFKSMSRIREALLNGSVTEALAWCTENKKELRKMEVCTASPTVSHRTTRTLNTANHISYRANLNSCSASSNTLN